MRLMKTETAKLYPENKNSAGDGKQVQKGTV